MKVCLIINSLEAGGAERVLSLLANHWSRHHDVHVITFRAPGVEPFYPLSPTIALHQLGREKRLRFWQKAWRVLPSAFKLRQTVRFIRPDCIISFVDLMNVFSLLALRGLGIRHIVSERIDPTEHKINLLLKIFRRIIYPWAYKIVIQGSYIAPYFQNYGSISVIPNPIVAPPLQFKQAEKNLKIITIGRLVPQKNHACLIQAFAAIADNYPDWTVDIFGEGADYESLRRLIKQLHMTNRIHLRGKTSDVYAELNRSSIFVFPSLYEGFPNALAEAMAVGLPVVASDIPGNQELIQNGVNGVLFKKRDISDLALKLSDLIDNESLRLTLGKKAKDILKTYGEEKVYALWDNLLR